MDIMVTTPKKEKFNAELEAANVVKDKAGVYFRYLGRYRPNFEIGDKVFYVENGFIRGYCLIINIEKKVNQKCGTTGRMWPNGWYVYQDATTWKWVKPIPYKGFQGWRYLNDLYNSRIEVVGGYLDPKP